MINKSGRSVAYIDLQTLHADLQKGDGAMISDEVELRQKLSEAKGAFIIGIAESVGGLIYSFSSNDWQGNFGGPHIFRCLGGSYFTNGRQADQQLFEWQATQSNKKGEANAAMASPSRTLRKARIRGDEWPMGASKTAVQPTEEQNDVFLAILVGRANSRFADLDSRIKYITRLQGDAGTPIQYKIITLDDFSEILKHPKNIEFRQKIRITRDNKEAVDVPLKELRAKNLASRAVVHFYRDDDRKINWYYVEGSDHWPILIKTKDPAMAGQEHVHQVGGIDFSHSSMNVRKEGLEYRCHLIRP